jgi:two-component sensor histidine kinase
VEDLKETYGEGDRRRFHLQTEPLSLATDQAVSLGVIVNELVTNACKYAYPADCEGDVRITLTLENEDAAVLIVEDDGVGMPAAPAPHGTGLGAKVLASMAHSLRSALVIDPAHRGVRATLRFAPEAPLTVG